MTLKAILRICIYHNWFCLFTQKINVTLIIQFRKSNQNVFIIKLGQKRKLFLFFADLLSQSNDCSSYEKETGWKLEQIIARTKRYKESQAFLAKNIFFCIVLTLEKKGCAKMVCMSPVFPVFHSEVTVLKTAVRMMASILKY